MDVVPAPELQIPRNSLTGQSFWLAPGEPWSAGVGFARPTFG
jgi:hypothetical protein